MTSTGLSYGVPSEIKCMIMMVDWSHGPAVHTQLARKTNGAIHTSSSLIPRPHESEANTSICLSYVRTCVWRSKW